MLMLRARLVQKKKMWIKDWHNWNLNCKFDHFNRPEFNLPNLSFKSNFSKLYANITLAYYKVINKFIFFLNATLSSVLSWTLLQWKPVKVTPLKFNNRFMSTVHVSPIVILIYVFVYGKGQHFFSVLRC